MIRNLVGKRFGRLVVIGKTNKRSWGKVVWHCHCDCGKDKDIQTRSLTSGNTKSCGCFRREVNKKAMIGNNHGLKHGDTCAGLKSSLYTVLTNMKTRCSNSNSADFKYYGGKGVSVCKEWRDDYSVFRKWALSHGYKSGLVIDRINNNGNYDPGNCQWITGSENSKKARRETKEKENDRPRNCATSI
jgi:hypothetical protein